LPGAGVIIGAHLAFSIGLLPSAILALLGISTLKGLESGLNVCLAAASVQRTVPSRQLPCSVLSAKRNAARLSLQESRRVLPPESPKKRIGSPIIETSDEWILNPQETLNYLARLQIFRIQGLALPLQGSSNKKRIKY
jgi:hypothetical protein